MLGGEDAVEQGGDFGAVAVDGSHLLFVGAGDHGGAHIVAAQVELRQSITRRLGFVVWYGGGTVFSDFGSLRWEDLLPSYGIGIRFEFKHNINLRVDYGFGRQSGGVIFSMGEAF